MSDPPSVLLTNDDGIDATGLAALRDHLRDRDDVGDVTVVAPADDESGVGVTRSWTRETLGVRRRPDGYAVRGTPADCVAFAAEALDLEFDAVVSGINDGPNLGAHILARSGTIGAAMEAALLGYPAIAVSWFDLDYDYDEGLPSDLAAEEFGLAAEVAGDLLGPFLAGELFPEADYCNLNAPSPPGPDEADRVVRVTRPSTHYEIEHDGDGSVGGGGDHGSVESAAADGSVRSAEEESAVELRSLFWRNLLDLEVPDGPDADRRACAEGEVSVSPLTVPGSVHEELIGRVLDPSTGRTTE